MANKERLITSILFISSLIMTLISALVLKLGLLVLIFLII